MSLRWSRFTNVSKKGACKEQVLTAYSRRRGKIVAFVVGNTFECPKEFTGEARDLVSVAIC